MKGSEQQTDRVQAAYMDLLWRMTYLCVFLRCVSKKKKKKMCLYENLLEDRFMHLLLHPLGILLKCRFWFS